MKRFFASYLIYILVWITVLVVHTLFLHLSLDIVFVISLIDALVFNTLFAMIAFGLWHLTSIYNLENRKMADLVINHMTIAAVSILIWVSASVGILSMFYSDDSAYVDFLDQSVPFRSAIGLLYYLMTVWTFYLIQTLEKARWQAQQQEKLTTMLKDAEIKVLRSQIHPHFLFNSLNSIHSLTMSDPAKAGEMIIKLSDLFRYSLSRQEQMVKFSEEISQVKRYLEIEKIRFSERLSVQFHIDPETEAIEVPSMILQPLLENAVKYGIYGVGEGVQIDVSAVMNGAEMEVIICNNFDPSSAVKKGTGMGLKNVQERLLAVYHRSNLLQTEQLNELFTVRIRFPKM